MADIVLHVQIAIPNGPKIDFNRTLTVEAFDMINVTVPADATKEKEIQLQPGGIGKVKFLLIVADWYGTDLSYKVNAGAGTARALDQPHLFTGSGGVSLLDAAALAKLLFKNATTGPKAKDVNVQILIGRDATP